VITSANNFLGQQAGMSRISKVQLAGSVRKFNLNRPFICPIRPGWITAMKSGLD
jgi:hypothetical protein